MTPGPLNNLAKDLSPDEFRHFRDWIHQHSGIYLEETKIDSLRISLVTRATRYGFDSFDQYYALLKDSEPEFKELMNLVTINETSFFRFPQQFEAFKRKVIPEILESKPKIARQFRVWSAGCSTGEEPYTIAMALLDSGLEGLGYRPEVLGTDVSTNALDRAKAAVYPAKSLDSLERSIVQRYFEPTKEGHRLTRRVRDVCEFSYHNLIKEPYPLVLMGNWDVVFCRNVTIYFRIESTRRVVHNFYESLNPGGYLFIGHSETLTNISDEFEPVEIDGVFLYRKPRPRKFVTFEDVVAHRSEALSRRRRGLAATDEPAPTPAKPLRARAAKPVPEPVVEESRESLTADALVSQAKRYLDQGEPMRALEHAQRAMAADHKNVDAFLVAAYAHADSGDLAAAAEEAEAAVKLDALKPAARYILGIIYQRRGDTARAIAEFKRTLYIDSTFVLAHFSLGNLYKSQGAKLDACREYENALRALYQSPDGEWTAFLGGFTPDLLVRTCELSLVECRKGR